MAPASIIKKAVGRSVQVLVVLPVLEHVAAAVKDNGFS